MPCALWRRAEADWPTVLCIDDDPHVRETIRLRLGQYEVDFLQASYGMHGFWLAMTDRPNVVVCDLKMPQGGGEYVVDCLRHNSDTHDIPVIVVTGQRDAALENKLRGLGVNDYFVKPVEFEQLRIAFGKYIPLIERESHDVNPAAARN